MPMGHILEEGARALGIELDERALEAFERYHALLEEKNSVMNLTAITGAGNVARLHFLDSLALLATAPFDGKTVIDVGSGAGFPGVPMKIAVPGLGLTLLDAQAKRTQFLEELCSGLGLGDVRCVTARAEEAARQPHMRDAFDFAVSRAVSRLNVLSELCLPFVKAGGALIAMKGTDSDEEIAQAARGIELLGGETERIFDYDIPGANVRHRAVVIRKKAPTPDGYPRRFARIQKSPL